MVSDLLNINQSPNWVLSLFGSIQKSPPADAWGWVAPEQNVVEVGTEE